MWSFDASVQQSLSPFPSMLLLHWSFTSFFFLIVIALIASSNKKTMQKSGSNSIFGRKLDVSIFFFSLCVLSWARLTPITIEVVEVPLDKKLVPISDKSITKDGKLNVLENKIQLVQKENRFHKPELVRLLKFFQMSRPWISQWIGTIHSPSVFEIDCANSHCAVRRYSKCYSNQSLLNDGLHLEGSYISALYLSFASYRNITKFTKTKITRTLVAKNNCDVRLKRNERTIIPQQETFEG